MTTDHRAEAERQISLADCSFPDSVARLSSSLLASAHATLADRCPDPAAHQAAADAELHGTVYGLRARIADMEQARRQERAEADAAEREIVKLRHHLDMAEDRQRTLAGVVDEKNVELANLRTELAEVRAAHQAEDTGEGDVAGSVHDALLEQHAADVAEIERLKAELADVWKHFKVSEEGRQALAQGLNAKLAEARAARPAPMLPEVVAVVEAAQDQAATWKSHGCDAGSPLVAALDALPEGWRDGAGPPAGSPREIVHRHAAEYFAPADPTDPSDAPPVEAQNVATDFAVDLLRSLRPAPAAVPAELDPAGVGRAARALYESIPEELRADWNETVAVNYRRRVSAAVRAYLGDTDTGSED